MRSCCVVVVPTDGASTCEEGRHDVVIVVRLHDRGPVRNGAQLSQGGLACALAFGIVSLSACSWVSREQFEPVPTYPRLADGARLALLEGDLLLLGDGCLVLDTEYLDEVLLLVWPPGTERSDQRVAFPDGVEWEIGSNVRGGGGSGADTPVVCGDVEYRTALVESWE